jgi:hypothetical protein
MRVNLTTPGDVMRFRFVFVSFLLLFLLPFIPSPSLAETDASVLEQSMSQTLDLWRDGRYDQLFERLSHRGKMSKERFAKMMGETSIRPACCFQKMENFKVLNEKRTEAIVYVKVGLEGTPNPVASSTREFKLSHEAGIWKMQLSDVTSLAGLTAKKGKHSTRKTNKTTSPYHQ